MDINKKGTEKDPAFDQWSGLADLLANLIEKYALDLDIEEMPDAAVKIGTKNKVDKTDRE